MKLWSFLFADPRARLQSALVAAPDRVGACLLLGALVEEPLSAVRRRPGEGVVVQWAGEIQCATPMVMTLTNRVGGCHEAGQP